MIDDKSLEAVHSNLSQYIWGMIDIGTYASELGLVCPSCVLGAMRWCLDASNSVRTAVPMVFAMMQAT